MFLLANAQKAIDTLPEWQVIVIGLGVVFVGLICIVLLCMAMGALVRTFTKPEKKADAPAPVAAAPVATEIPNRQQVIAAVSAVIAEEMGTDVSKLRIRSFKQI